MNFTVEGKEYAFERAIATQQTGCWMLCQARNWLPDEIGGIIWFGVDDAATSCLTPVYSASTRVPECFAVGNGDMMTYSPTSAFWLFNRVAQFAYLRYNLLEPEIVKAADKHLMEALETIPTIDTQAQKMFADNPSAIKEYLTGWSELLAAKMFNAWKELDQYLLVKYIDGNIKAQNPDGSFKDNGQGKGIPAKVKYGGYSRKFLEAVAADPDAQITRVP